MLCTLSKKPSLGENIIHCDMRNKTNSLKTNYRTKLKTKKSSKSESKGKSYVDIYISIQVSEKLKTRKSQNLWTENYI